MLDFSRNVFKAGSERGLRGDRLHKPGNLRSVPTTHP